MLVNTHPHRRTAQPNPIPPRLASLEKIAFCVEATLNSETGQNVFKSIVTQSKDLGGMRCDGSIVYHQGTRDAWKGRNFLCVRWLNISKMVGRYDSALLRMQCFCDGKLNSRLLEKGIFAVELLWGNRASWSEKSWWQRSEWEREKVT